MIKKSLQSGTILIQAFVFGMISVVIIGALVAWAGTTIHASRSEIYREQALQIAEAGIDYYRWHLAHNSTDFSDGSTTPNGSYIHNYYDKDGNKIGTFTLNITAPLIGSTLVTILSTGRVTDDATVARQIKVKLGMPSLAKYDMVTNSVVMYGSGDEVFGPIHSNSGVIFYNGSPQPVAHNMVTSALSTYGGQFGVYTTVTPGDPSPPSAVPARPDVFQAGRTFPVAAVDFVGITADLSALKTQGQSASGFYRAASGASGYKIVLKTDDTFDLYKVNTLLGVPNGNCKNSYGSGQTGWGTWSIGSTGGSTTLLGTYAFPTNGVMYFEDNIWVEGQINGARLTIAAGTLPIDASKLRNITVNNNLTYTNFDGTDTLGLIAQNNFLVGMASADNLTIDAAIIAQTGGTIRYYYDGNCSPWDLRNTLTTYGMFGSNLQGYFYYGNSGYAHQPASYDPNLLYSPPPSFPLTSNQYQIVSWQMIK